MPNQHVANAIRIEIGQTSRCKGGLEDLANGAAGGPCFSSQSLGREFKPISVAGNRRSPGPRLTSARISACQSRAVLSTVQIASRYGSSSPAVLKLMNEYSIPRRSWLAG